MPSIDLLASSSTLWSADARAGTPLARGPAAGPNSKQAGAGIEQLRAVRQADELAGRTVGGRGRSVDGFVMRRSIA